MAERSFDDWMKAANAAYKAGEMAQAVEGYAEALALSPDDAQALERHARAAVRAGDRDAAIASYLSLSRLQPANADVLDRLARLCHAAGRRDAAADAWRRLLAVNPDRREALDHLARHAYGAGRMAEAADLFGRLAAADPEDREPRYRQAAALRSDRRLEEALTTVDGLLTDDPGDLRALLLRADILRRRAFAHPPVEAPPEPTPDRDEDVALAVEAARLVCDAEPDDAAHWRALARLLSRTDQEAAMDAWSRAHDLEPADAETNRTLAELALDRGRHAEARGCADAVLAQEPDDGRMLLLRAWLDWREGRTDEGGSFLDRLPADGGAWPETDGDISLPEPGSTAEAESLAGFYDALSSRWPGMAAVWLRLVRSRLRAGDVAEAARLADRAMALFGGQRAERRKLSRILSLAQRYDDAIRVLAPLEDDADRLEAIHVTLASGDVATGLPRIEEWSRGIAADRLPAAEIARWRAIAAKAGAAASDPESALDMLAARIAALTPADTRRRNGMGVIMAAASLRAGGAERALAATVSALQSSEPDFPVCCVFESLDPAQRADALLPDFPGTPGARPLLADFDHPDLRPWRQELDMLPPDMAQRIASNFVWLRGADARILHLWQDRIGIEWGLAGLMAGFDAIVIHIHSLRPRVRQAQKHFRQILRRLAGFSEIRFVACARACAADYADWLGLPADAIGDVIYNPVTASEPPPSARADLRAALGFPADATVVGTAFRFVPDKLPEQWIEMASLVAGRRSDVRFAMFGDGPMCRRIMDMAAGRGLADRIAFPGHVDGLAERLAGLDVFCLTSAVEGLPTVTLEAQAAGVPVVAYDVGGVRETIVEGTSGRLVPAGQPDRIAAAVLTVLDDPGWRRRAGEAGREHVTGNFAPAAIAAAWRRLYREIAP